jgi:DNA-binding response OmpR family regulator
MRVLVVEDEPVLREGLCDLLRGDGHEVDSVGDGLSAVERGTDGAYDVLVLDRMLPRLDGIEVCRRLKHARPSLAVLMLTARASEDDKVDGLLEGADDYVTKPFGARELLARVRVLGRRAPAPFRTGEPEIVELDGCQLDLGRAQARRGDSSTELTAREVAILRFLHQHRARAVTRGELLEQVWHLSASMQTRTVDVTIGNLRKKIERDVTDPRIVISSKGIGYAWGDRS